MIFLYLILSFSCFSQWSNIDGKLKLEHEVKNIEEMRYSIDQENIILVNDVSVNYFNKLSGDFSKSYSIIYKDTTAEFDYRSYNLGTPKLSFYETHLSYSLNPTSGTSEVFFNIKSGKFDGANYSEVSNTPYDRYYGSYTLSDLKCRFYFTKYDYNFVKENHPSYSYSTLIYTYDLQDQDFKRIERIDNNVRYNTKNYDLMYKDINNKLVVKRFNEENNSELRDVFFNNDNILGYTFSENQNDMIYVETKNIINDLYINKICKVNYDLEEISIDYTDIPFTDICYLKSGYYLSLTNKEAYILKSDRLKLLNKIDFDKEILNYAYDSTTNDLFILSNNSEVYKYKIDFKDQIYQAKCKIQHVVEVKDTCLFFNTSIGEFDEILWDFGDGNMSSLENPIHIYEKSGVYNVVFKIKLNNEYHIIEQEVKVEDKISSEFDITVLDNISNNRIKLTPRESNQDFSFKWLLNGELISTDYEIEIELDKYINFIALYVSSDVNYKISEVEYYAIPSNIKDNFKTITSAFNKFKQGIILSVNYDKNEDFLYSNFPKNFYEYYIDHNNEIRAKVEEKNMVYYGNKNGLDTMSFIYKSYYSTLNHEYLLGWWDYIDRGYNLNFWKKNDQIYISKYDISVKNANSLLDFSRQNLIKLKSNDGVNFTKDTSFIDEIVDINHMKPYISTSCFFNDKLYIASEYQIFNMDLENNREVIRSTLYNENSKLKNIKGYKFFEYDDKLYLCALSGSLKFYEIKETDILTEDITTSLYSTYLKDIYFDNEKFYYTSSKRDEERYFVEYDFINDKKIRTLYSKTDSINDVAFVDGYIVFFGKYNGKPAYEITDGLKYHFKVFDFEGEFIKSTTNEKDEIYSIIRLGVEEEYFLVTMNMENKFLNVNSVDEDKFYYNENYFQVNHNNYNLEFYDVNGKTIKSIKNSSEKNIDLSNLPSGVYLYKLTFENKTYTGKFSK